MLPPLKIMIVDDDRTTLAILAAVLEESGHKVIQRHTAIGTTLAIIRESPDVVVLDVRMPGLSGDKLATLIADRQSDPPPIVILHSGSTRAELEALARTCGASGVVEKNPDPQEFLKRFETVVSAAQKKRAAPSGARRTL